jgi:hypothetical protein
MLSAASGSAPRNSRGLRARRIVVLPILTAALFACLPTLAQTQVDATMISPANGATGVSPSVVFSWTTGTGAQAYYLYVGSSVGTNNIYNGGATTATSTSVPGLASNTTYYVRLWTEFNNAWNHFVDSTFTTGSGSPTQVGATMISPANGATGVSPTAPFTWTTGTGAQAYYLYVGTSVGSSNVFNSGATSSTSLSVPGLAAGTTYFIRLWTEFNNIWNHYVDSTFTTASGTSGSGPSQLLTPANGATNASPFQAFTWSSVSDAQAYYLWVGTSPGTTDIYSTGSLPTSVTSKFVPGLLGGQTYYATMWTLISNQWQSVASSFTTATQPLPPNASAFRTSVQQQTAAVRLMTQGLTNIPIAGTALAQQVASAGHTQALSTDNARTLVPMLLGLNISVRLRDVLFDGSDTETHEMTEYYDPFLSQWIVTDPTFGITYWNPSTNTGLSVNQISADVLSQNFSAIPTVLVTSNGTQYANNYYMDPILLYLNVLPTGVFTTQGPVANSPLPFMTNASSDVGVAGYYVFSFVNQTDRVGISTSGGTLTLGPTDGSPFSSDTQLSSKWSITSMPSGLGIYTINRYKF